MTASNNDNRCLSLIQSSAHLDKSHVHVIIIMGASGDLARRKIYPVLWWLYRDNLLPKTYIIGYARSNLSVPELRNNSAPYTKVTEKQSAEYEEFWRCNYYHKGDYVEPEGYQTLNKFIIDKWGHNVNRIFYFAVPPPTYESIAANISQYCTNNESHGLTRLVIEKPFGRDLTTSCALSASLAQRFKEDQIYRMDHYLGKEMVQNLTILRFSNQVLHYLWNREHVHNVTITFKEPLGIEGRGGYFDEFGIIRDVVQNHLMQILSLVAMDQPKSMEPEDIRDAKVEVLRSVQSAQLSDIIVGQYIADPKATSPPANQSYTDDPKVPKDSITPTYVCMVLYINNERWKGVPFIFRAGKALNEQKAEVRIQFKEMTSNLFCPTTVHRNELVVRVQPNEAVYLKLHTKAPGMSFEPEQTELDLTYSNRYQDIKLPDAYERLFLDVLCGNQTNFVRSDELEEAWRILTPVLDQMQKERVKPLPYVFGCRDGPEEADKLRSRAGYKYSATYTWPSKGTPPSGTVGK